MDYDQRTQELATQASMEMASETPSAPDDSQPDWSSCQPSGPSPVQPAEGQPPGPFVEDLRGYWAGPVQATEEGGGKAEHGEDGSQETGMKVGSAGASTIGAGLDGAAHAIKHGTTDAMTKGMAGQMGRVGGAFGVVGGGLEEYEGVKEMANARDSGEVVHGGLKTAAGAAEVMGGVGAMAGASTPSLLALGPLGFALGAGVLLGDAIAPLVFDDKPRQKNDGKYVASTGSDFVDWVAGVGKSGGGGPTSYSDEDSAAAAEASQRATAQYEQAKAAGDEKGAAQASKAQADAAAVYNRMQVTDRDREDASTNSQKAAAEYRRAQAAGDTEAAARAQKENEYWAAKYNEYQE